MRQDDMDTLADIDNQNLSTKSFSIELGDFTDENYLWMHVVEDYLWREDSKDSCSLGEIGFLRLSSDTFKFIGIPSNLTSRDLDALRVELDLMGVES